LWTQVEPRNYVLDRGTSDYPMERGTFKGMTLGFFGMLPNTDPSGSDIGISPHALNQRSKCHIQFSHWKPLWCGLSSKFFDHLSWPVMSHGFTSSSTEGHCLEFGYQKMLTTTYYTLAFLFPFCVGECHEILAARSKQQSWSSSSVITVVLLKDYNTSRRWLL